MRFVKFLASIIFSLIIILAIGSYFAAKNFDLNKYKVYAEEMAEKELGRKLLINGNASVGISLIPTVIVNDVELANPSWAHNPQMVKLKQIEVKFALLPLLKKQIVIDEVVLSEPEIYLEKAANGAASWDFNIPAVQKATANIPTNSIASSSAAKAPAAALMAGFAARNVSIEKGKVEYYDAASNQLTKVVINEISLQVPSYNDNISLAFNVLYDKQKISGESELGSLAQLMSEGENFPFTITAEAMGISADLNGGLSDMMKSPRYAVAANIYNPAGNFNAPETTLKARIDGDVKGLNAKIETLNIVNNLISGTLDVRWDSKVPQISANLQSPKINLQNFNSNSNFAFEIPSIISEAQALQSVPNKPIPYNLLYVANANVKLKIAQLIMTPGMTASNVNMSAVLKNGRLSVTPLVLDFGGGSINANLYVDAALQNVSLKAQSQNMLLQNLHREFVISSPSDFGVQSGGKTDMDIDVSGSGSTYRQLVQSLNGQVIGIVNASVIQTGGLQFVSGNFLTQLLSALRINLAQTKNLDLTCAVVRADLKGGKAVFPKGIAVDSKQLTVVSNGRVNMVNDEIAFTIEPSMNKLASGNITQALASFIKVGGTLENPKIMIDDKEALKTIVGVAATGGLPYLGSQVVLNGSGSPCYTALEGTPYAARFPKPTGVKAVTQDVYKDTNKQINQGIKDLKKTAKDLLKMF